MYRISPVQEMISKTLSDPSPLGLRYFFFFLPGLLIFETETRCRTRGIRLTPAPATYSKMHHSSVNKIFNIKQILFFSQILVDYEQRYIWRGYFTVKYLSKFATILFMIYVSCKGLIQSFLFSNYLFTLLPTLAVFQIILFN